MKAAIYARVSTGLQVENTSLDDQIEACKKKADELNLFDIEIYREEGFSGEDIDRPQMNRLRQDVARGLISHVICVHPDRFSRNLVDKLLVCGEFERRNVNLVFVDTEYKNTPEGQLFFNMHSVIAQYELERIKKRTTRGRIKAVEQGRIMPMRVAPYGYDYINGRLVINEEEAKFVRMIYDWYIRKNMTLREIGEKLFELGSRPKRSNVWNATSISRILTSEIYIGKYYYNRRQTKKIKGEKTESGNPRKTYTYRDESEWVCVEVPAIIDEHTFQLAQKQREKNKTFSGNVKYDFLLKGMIRCSHCGRIWQATTYTGSKDRYRCYRCPNKYPRKYGAESTKCETPTIRAEVLEDYVWSKIIEVMSNPEDYLSRVEDKKEDFSKDIQNTIDLINQKLNEKEKAKEKIKVMFVREVITEEEMVNDLQKINEEIKALKAQKEAMEKHLQDRLKEQMSKEKIEKIFSMVQSLLSDDQGALSFKEKRHIVGLLADEILIRCKGDNIEITFTGALNKLLGSIDGNDPDDDPDGGSYFVSSTQHQHDMNTKQSNEVMLRSRFKLGKKRVSYFNGYVQAVLEDLGTELIIK